MKVKEKPKITKNSRKPYTQVTYIPDYARFKQPGLTDDMIKIIEKRTYDMAAWTDNTVNVYLNGEKIESKKSCFTRLKSKRFADFQPIRRSL